MTPDYDLEPLYTDEEVLAGSGRTTQFTHADVMLAKRRILAAGVLPEIAHWREADRAADPKGPGGRPPVTALDDIHILIAYMLLVKEHTPTWTKEVRNLSGSDSRPRRAHFSVSITCITPGPTISRARPGTAELTGHSIASSTPWTPTPHFGEQ